MTDATFELSAGHMLTTLNVHTDQNTNSVNFGMIC